MKQEFIIGPIKIEQDDSGFGVSVLVDNDPETYEVRANFLDPIDMLGYAHQIAMAVEQQRQAMMGINEINGENS